MYGKVTEIELNYTACQRYNETTKKEVEPRVFCSDVIATNWKTECICRINFTLKEDIRRDVYLYYGLTNFYQNHRRYVKSIDDRQLLGERKGSTECEPFAQRDGKWIAPCGAIANSLFNDTFFLKRESEDEREPKSVPITQIGIAWATDKNAKFRNPVVPDGQNLSFAFKDTVPPPNWRKAIYELDTKDSNNGYLNEGLIVWMRTAALPTFRKLYARIAHDKQDIDTNYQNSLPRGKYVLFIKYSES